MNTQELKANRKLLKEWSYDWTPLDKGCTDKTLYINVGTKEIKEKNVPLEMKEKFIGGKGYGLRLLWDGTDPRTKWNDPENEIVIAPGPIATKISQDAFQLPNSPYEEKISRMRTKRDLSIQEGVEPPTVAQKVLQILQTRHPKPYYPVGKGAKLKTFLIKHLPETLVEKIVLKKYDQL